MKKLALLLTLIVAQPVHAACFAEYKAKRDKPLQLHYGVAEIPPNDCSVPAAETVLRPRLAVERWSLLTVLSVFGEDRLNEVRANAGEYFLRY